MTSEQRKLKKRMATECTTYPGRYERNADVESGAVTDWGPAEDMPY